MNTRFREASDRSRGAPGVAIKKRMRSEDGSKEAQGGGGQVKTSLRVARRKRMRREKGAKEAQHNQ